MCSFSSSSAPQKSMAAMGRSRSRPLSFLNPLPTVLLLVFLAVAGHAAAATSPLEQKCAGEVGTKLIDCLAYAKGQADAPTSKCCQSTADIRSKDPACLCYVIHQTYIGTPSFKQLGLQLARMVQLTAACKIPNSNITDCPRLLDIEPSSPAYGIFNITSGNNTSVGPNSEGTMSQVHYYIYAVACAVASALVLFS